MMLQELIHFGVVAAYVLVLLPIFSGLHRLFSPRRQSLKRQFFVPFQWLFDLILTLRQVSSQTAARAEQQLRKVMLFFMLFCSLFPLLSLPLFGNGFGASTLSAGFFFSFLFFQGIFTLGLGLTSTDELARVYMLEQFFSRQALIIAITLSCLTLPYTHSGTLYFALQQQMGIYSRFIPHYGIFSSPIAFFIAMIALALYTRQWLENEVPLRANLINSIENELPSSQFAVFTFSRELEYLTIHALLVALFLGGPFLATFSISPIMGCVVFGTKILATSLVALAIGQVLPHYFRERAFRVAILWLIPFLLLTNLLRSALAS